MWQDWDDFFTTTAQVAVTAFSIMFLSMQVKSSVWRGRRLLSVAAVAALVELFVPLLASLITTMSGHPWRAASLLAGGAGLVMVAVHWATYFIERRKETPSKFDQRRAWGNLLSFVIYGLVVLSATNLGSGGLWLLAAMCVWLIFSGSFEAWWLLEPNGISTGGDNSDSDSKSSP